MIVVEYQNDVHFIFNLVSLGSITCPGSLGIISARYLEHPFETVANIEKYLEKQDYTKNLHLIADFKF